MRLRTAPNALIVPLVGLALGACVSTPPPDRVVEGHFFNASRQPSTGRQLHLDKLDSSAPRITTSTDANGWFSFDDLDAGSYLLSDDRGFSTPVEASSRGLNQARLSIVYADPPSLARSR